MATSARRGEDERVVLGLLEFVEQDAAKTQRRLAAELGMAVGLVNAYLNRCIQKGAGSRLLRHRHGDMPTT